MFSKNSMDKIDLIQDKMIKRNLYENKYEYIFDKKTNYIPKKNNRLLIIMFSENKSCRFLYRKFDNKNDTFRYNKGLYVIDNEAIHLTRNGNRICFYLEGISTPIKMSYIEKNTEIIEYFDLNGEKKTAHVEKIKGLKYDSKILDIICDRKLSENFTQIDEKFKYALFTLIFVLVGLVLTGVNIAISYLYR